MHLTEAQIRRCNVISAAVERSYGHPTARAAFAFKLHHQWDDGSIMLCASNLEDMRYFETHYYAHVVITKRGGIERYSGNMHPKLVLPATPRRCEYTDPFK